MPSYNDISKSREAPESKKKLAPVATGTVSKDAKKVNFIVEIFKPIVYDAVSKMLKTAMDTVSDLVVGAADMRMYGEYKHQPKRGYTNYSGISKLSRGYSGSLLNVYEDFDLSGRRSYKAGYEVKTIEFDTYGDAELVLDALRETADKYNSVCVGDYYALCQAPSTHTDYGYGWENLDRADVRRFRNKYIIVLPRPIPLD